MALSIALEHAGKHLTISRALVFLLQTKGLSRVELSTRSPHYSLSQTDGCLHSGPDVLQKHPSQIVIFPFAQFYKRQNTFPREDKFSLVSLHMGICAVVQRHF